jgi:hypothetical protein
MTYIKYITSLVRVGRLKEAVPSRNYGSYCQAGKLHIGRTIESMDTCRRQTKLGAYLSTLRR